MSTASEREAALRRALLSAAAQVEPAPGGLQRIQARLGRPRPLPVAWLTAAWTSLVMRAPDVFEAMRRSGASALRLVVERFGPRSAADAGSQRLSWLRPLAAMSVAVFVLGAGIYLGLAGPGSFFGVTDSNQSGAVNTGTSHAGKHAGSGGPSVLGTGSTTANPGPAASSSTTCPPAVSRFKAGQPSAGASTPSTSSSASPSDSTSPSTSVSPSTTPDPGTTPPATGAAAASPDAAQASDSASADGAGITGTGASASGRNADPANTHAAAHGATSAGSGGPASTASTQSLTRSACGKNLKKKGKHSGKSRTATTSTDISALTSATFAVAEPGKAAKARLA
jgi:hypothetical protein